MALIMGQVDCTANVNNTGVIGCAVDMAEIQFLILTKKGWNIASGNTFDKAYFDEQVQKKNFIILPKPVSVESDSEDAVYETFDNGLKMFVRDGKIEYVVTFANGSCFHKALRSLSGGAYDLLMVDVKEQVWGVKTTTGFKAFDINLIQAESKILATGSESAKSPFRIQFSAKGTAEWNISSEFIKPDSFAFDTINGVIDVKLMPGTPVAGKVVVKAVVGCDGTTPLDQFTNVSDWRVLDNSGVPEVISAVNYVNGEYQLTIANTGAMQTQLYDSLLSTIVIENGGLYFQSDVDTQTVQ